MTTKREQRKLDRRLLAVEDPIEMKTEPGREVVIPATPEQIAADEGATDDESLAHRRDQPLHRSGPIHILGVGEVT